MTVEEVRDICRDVIEHHPNCKRCEGYGGYFIEATLPAVREKLSLSNGEIMEVFRDSLRGGIGFENLMHQKFDSEIEAFQDELIGQIMGRLPDETLRREWDEAIRDEVLCIDFDFSPFLNQYIGLDSLRSEVEGVFYWESIVEEVSKSDKVFDDEIALGDLIDEVDEIKEIHPY